MLDNLYSVPSEDEEDDLEVRTRAVEVTAEVFKTLSLGREDLLTRRQDTRAELEDAFVSFAQTVEKYLRTGE
jgi:hypothetical protein